MLLTHLISGHGTGVCHVAMVLRLWVLPDSDYLIGSLLVPFGNIIITSGLRRGPIFVLSGSVSGSTSWISRSSPKGFTGCDRLALESRNDARFSTKKGSFGSGSVGAVGESGTNSGVGGGPDGVSSICRTMLSPGESVMSTVLLSTVLKKQKR